MDGPRAPFNNWLNADWLTALTLFQPAGWPELYASEIMKHENWYNEDYMSAKRREVVDKATSLIKGSIDFLDGVRDMFSLQYEVSDDDADPDFRVFVAIYSETDHIPAAELRDFCSVSWLAKCDKDMEKVKETYRDEVIGACRRLIRRFAVNA